MALPYVLIGAKLFFWKCLGCETIKLFMNPKSTLPSRSVNLSRPKFHTLANWREFLAYVLFLTLSSIAAPAWSLPSAPVSHAASDLLQKESSLNEGDGEQETRGPEDKETGEQKDRGTRGQGNKEVREEENTNHSLFTPHSSLLTSHSSPSPHPRHLTWILNSFNPAPF